MARRNPTGAFWPSNRAEQLLVAALGDRLETVTAWQELGSRFSLDELERGSFAVLPLVYWNLVRANHHDSLLPRLKGIYRKTWVTNNLLAERMRSIRETLDDAGIRTLFVEGVAIAGRFYPELGLRPTSSVDVLVDESAQPAALSQLAQAGWNERPGSASGRSETRYLADGSGNVCVLRTSLAIDFVARGGRESAHAPLWAAAERAAVGGVDVLVPLPTDTLLAVCVSHVRSEGAPNAQWIVDAKMLLAAEIDWERLLAIGTECGQALRLRNTFRYLATLPGSTAPGSVLDELEATRVSRRERLSYLCTAGTIRGVGALPVHVAEHLATSTNESPLRTIATFPGHLRDRWRLAHSWQVPFAAARRAIRLLGVRDRGGT